MDTMRMKNSDMINYCNEALSWEALGPFDIFFFESVKKILLGQCSPVEEQDDSVSDNDIEGLVEDTQLESEYEKFADIYYNDGDEELPNYTTVKVEDTFPDSDFGGGFFTESTGIEMDTDEDRNVGFTVEI